MRSDLEEKVAAPVYKAENMTVGIRCAEHATPSIRKSWRLLRRQAAVSRSVLFASGLRPRSLFVLFVNFWLSDIQASRILIQQANVSNIISHFFSYSETNLQSAMQ
jgi:hypothetical protein